MLFACFSFGSSSTSQTLQGSDSLRLTRTQRVQIRTSLGVLGYGAPENRTATNLFD